MLPLHIDAFTESLIIIKLYFFRPLFEDFTKGSQILILSKIFQEVEFDFLRELLFLILLNRSLDYICELIQLHFFLFHKLLIGA